jgi:hypothetical protein
VSDRDSDRKTIEIVDTTMRDGTLLRDVLRHERFAGGAVTTRWLEEEALAP